MGEAFVGALTGSEIFSPQQISISDISDERLQLLTQQYGVKGVNDNFSVFSDSDIVVLAVKPQQMDDVLSRIIVDKRYAITRRKLIISIAAGVRIKKLEDYFYPSLTEDQRKNTPIIRVMPNTPALVLSGMSGMSPNPNANDEDITTCKTILKAMGRVIEFQEKDLDAVTAVSGSGPAYVFYFIESMIEAGIDVGLTPEDSAILTITTLRGALNLMIEQNDTPENLRRKVTSPGGTTEAALKVFEKNNVKQTIIEAIAAATERSRELSK